MLEEMSNVAKRHSSNQLECQYILSIYNYFDNYVLITKLFLDLYLANHFFRILSIL